MPGRCSTVRGKKHAGFELAGTRVGKYMEGGIY